MLDKSVCNCQMQFQTEIVLFPCLGQGGNAFCADSMDASISAVLPNEDGNSCFTIATVVSPLQSLGMAGSLQFVRDCIDVLHVLKLRSTAQ